MNAKSNLSQAGKNLSVDGSESAEARPAREVKTRETRKAEEEKAREEAKAILYTGKLRGRDL